MLREKNPLRARALTQIQTDEKKKCIVGNCNRNGANFIISEGYLIPICDSHYEQAIKIGGQL